MPVEILADLTVEAASKVIESGALPLVAVVMVAMVGMVLAIAELL